MASKSAILRLVPTMRAELSPANATRLDKVVELLNPQGTAVLADVLRVLYPGQKLVPAQAAFRQFRRAVDLAAKDAKIRLSIETDGQTRAAAKDRVVSFEAE